MIKAWKETGEILEAISSRLVTARLKVSALEREDMVKQGRPLHLCLCDVSIWSNSLRVSILGVKVSSLMNSKLASTILYQKISLGDFNAHIGKREK